MDHVDPNLSSLRCKQRAQTHEDKPLAKISVAIKGLCQKQSHETATKGHHYFSAKISEKGKIEQNSSFNI